MAITSSAKKALRASKRKRVFNLRRKNAIDNQFKQFRKAVAAKNKPEAEKLTPSLYQALDTAVKIGYMKQNTSSRLKSRAMAALNGI